MRSLFQQRWLERKSGQACSTPQCWGTAVLTQVRWDVAGGGCGGGRRGGVKVRLIQDWVARERNKTPVSEAERCNSVSVEHRHFRVHSVTLQGDCAALCGDMEGKKIRHWDSVPTQRRLAPTDQSRWQKTLQMWSLVLFFSSKASATKGRVHTHQHTHTHTWRCFDCCQPCSSAGSDWTPSCLWPRPLPCALCVRSGDRGMGCERSRQPRFQDLGKRPS